MTAVVTDLGILKPDPVTRELVLVNKHPGTTVSEIQTATGWSLRSHDNIVETTPPAETELAYLRELD